MALDLREKIREKTEQPQAKIESISPTGLVEIAFSQEMLYLDSHFSQQIQDYENEQGNKVLNLEFLANKDADLSKLAYSWKVKAFRAYTLQL